MGWFSDLVGQGRTDSGVITPLGENKPKKVITAKGSVSYDEFAEKQTARHHQHGAVHPLMSVLGVGGATSQSWNMGAAEDITPGSQWAMQQVAPSGMVHENLGQHTLQKENSALVSTSAQLVARRHVSQSGLAPNPMSSTWAGITPSMLR